MEEKNAVNEGEKVSTIAPEDIFIITELAQIGLKSLKETIPSIRDVVAKGGCSLTKENLDHLESLCSEGENTVVHFSNMCQYLDDASKAMRKDKDMGCAVPNGK